MLGISIWRMRNGIQVTVLNMYISVFSLRISLKWQECCAKMNRSMGQLKRNGWDYFDV